MTLAQAALAFAALLVIVDPVALAPVFGALTRDMAPAQARRTALIAVVAGVAMIGAAGLAGHAVLRALGAEMALVHLALAAALLVMGLMLALGRGGLQAAGETPRRNPALFPLAFPLIAGPGALGAMVMLTGKHTGQDDALVTLYALLAVVGALTFAAMVMSGPLTRRLGPRGGALITRVMGLALIGASARFLYEGLRDYGVVGA